jgi:hypothetical protein
MRYFKICGHFAAFSLRRVRNMKVNGVALDLHELQADVKAGMTRGVKQVNTRGTKAARTYVGFWGLATDEIKGLFSDGKQLLEEAEGRGASTGSSNVSRPGCAKYAPGSTAR